MVSNNYMQAYQGFYQPPYPQMQMQTQAHAQTYSGYPSVTPEGYTLSSTYTPSSFNTQPTPNLLSLPASRPPPPQRPQRPHVSNGNTNSNPRGNGNSAFRCTYEKCTYMGNTKKDLMFHRMDHHLIYPEGWQHRKKEAKPTPAIPIPGTNIVLDTPDAIQKWIEERKRKWPSKQRIEEKEKERAEAIARGEISAEPRRKRQRRDDGEGGGGSGRFSSRGRGRGRGRGGRGMSDVGRGAGIRGRGYGRGGARGGHAAPQALQDMEDDTPYSDSSSSSSSSSSNSGSDESDGEEEEKEAPPLAKAATKPAAADSGSNSDSDSDSGSGSDMDPVKDAISSKTLALPLSPPVDSHEPPATEPDEEARSTVTADDTDQKHPPQPIQSLQPPSHRRPLQPRAPPRNPFAPTARPSLLRALLAPDIRATVSNLSQSIRFLVANDFLRGVERWAGEAEEVKRAGEMVVEVGGEGGAGKVDGGGGAENAKV
ncbi:hypothetical protein BOTBODRAFT_33990 [Botryobasidium botryosum FD-172 SS1]|uniref:FMR1-interacting protein 1 conserved domain-containing protein n=1 Tax=Botryobasidium botryosum (strain FD-172 SS1) TaxID=930990 RepID=A0A067MBD2_BOTB1|nr:hypothetical protein BOTBODRAFT_33990 [Botryobasidium botryosum FD-172 SS1]